MDNKLPTEEMKEFGIINEDNSFSPKLSADDVMKFLQGYTIVADNEKNRATFQLTDDNTKLKVIFLERNQSISEILEKSKNEIQFSDTFSQYNTNEEKSAAQLSWSKTAFIFDKESNKTVEFDFIKNAKELTAIVADFKNSFETNRYKTELDKLKAFLQDKIDQYPEMAKEITNDLNIVSREINTVDSISENQSQSQKQDKTNIQLNVNDPDFYQEANQIRVENEEQDEEIQKSRGFKR